MTNHKLKRKPATKGRDLPPPGTLSVWFVHIGDGALRKDYHVSSSREAALVWQEENLQRGMRVSAAHIMPIRGRWYKVQVRTVACNVPLNWTPSYAWLRGALGLELPPLPPPPLPLPAVAFTFFERMRILFTGLPPSY